MDEIMKNILLISVIGGILALVLLCIKPLTKKLFSPCWQYYIWLTVLIVMVLPIKVPLSAQPVHIKTTDNTAVQTEQIMPAEIQQEQAQPVVFEELSQNHALRTPDIPINILRLSGLLWLAVAGLLLGYKMVKYSIFIEEIKKNSVIERDLGNIPKRLTVRKTELLDAPLIVGLIKPVLYLPQAGIKEDELDYILLHELTHYRRHDLLYKWFAMLVSSIHWFNPLVYIVSKQIDEECEMSCDYEVCKNLSEQQKKDYMAMILDFVQFSIRKKRPLTTQMASSKKMLERRFIMIKNKKATSKLISILSAVVAIAMLSTTVFASGVLSGLTEDSYTIEITNNGEIIELVNKPFIENGEVYVPLREMFEKIGVMEHPDSKIEWNNGRIDLRIAYYDDVAITAEYQSLNSGQRADTITFIFGHAIEIGKSSIIANVVPNLAGQDISQEVTMANAPILRGGNTYIPYSYINYLLNTENWKMGYIAYDTEGNIFALTSSPIYNENIGDIPANQIKHIDKAELIENGMVYTITNKNDLTKLENILTPEEEIIGGTSCSFTADLILTFENGRKGKITIATDNCGIFKTEEKYYKYADYNNEICDLFGVTFEPWLYKSENTENQPFTNGENASSLAEFKEYSIKIPDSWAGKYTVQSTDNKVTFLQTATYEKYGDGSGALFSIEKVSVDDAEEILNLLGGSRLLYSNGQYSYIFIIPTDVQYPIWADRDEEDVEIAAEYESMSAYIDFIANTFALLDAQ